MPTVSFQDQQFGINALSLFNKVCAMLDATTTNPTTPALLLASLTTVAGLQTAISNITGLDNTQRAIRDELNRAITVCNNVRLPTAIPVLPTGGNLTTATSGGHLKDNTTYYFRVTAIDDLGNEGFPSLEGSKATSAGAAVDDNTITIKNMAAINGAVSYRLYISETSGTYTGYLAVTKASIEGASGYTVTATLPTDLTTASLPTSNPATTRYITDADVSTASSTDTQLAFQQMFTGELLSAPAVGYTSAEQWV